MKTRLTFVLAALCFSIACGGEGDQPGGADTGGVVPGPAPGSMADGGQVTSDTMTEEAARARKAAAGGPETVGKDGGPPVPAAPVGIVLEPYRDEKVALAKPIGWRVEHPADGQLRVLPPNPQALGVAGIVIQNEERAPQDVAPKATDQLDELVQEVGGRYVTEVSRSDSGWEFATAIVESPKLGVSVMHVRNFSLIGGATLTSVGLFLSTSAKAIEAVQGKLVVETIVATLDPPPLGQAQSLVGAWESIAGKSGGAGVYQRLIFTADGTYMFASYYSASGPIIAGSIIREEQGTYKYDGATVTFQGTRCAERFLDSQGTVKDTVRCFQGSTPWALRIDRTSTGLSVRGIGLEIWKEELFRVLQMSPAKGVR